MKEKLGVSDKRPLAEQEFCHILEKNMQPVYDSARRQGYEIWNRDKVQ